MECRQMDFPKKVTIVEVGPRDGLQNEKEFVATATKIELVNRLIDAGAPKIEAASFVSPKWVPQMADAAEVMQGIERKPGVVYAALTPNVRGLEGALANGADEVVIFGAASEAFSQKNINCSIAESIERFADVARLAKESGVLLRASISTAFGCPYQGEVSIDSVLDVTKRMQDLGCDEIDIADTIGVGTAAHVYEVMRRVTDIVPKEKIAGHFHDTYGQALANILASMQTGVSIYHSSVAGLGGCPYAKGATGNVATEDVLYMLHGMGIETGMDLDKTVQIGQWISDEIGRRNASSVGRAMIAKCAP
jgi:hydroxymethylglutaryl-CoA lyase